MTQVIVNIVQTHIQGISRVVAEPDPELSNIRTSSILELGMNNGRILTEGAQLLLQDAGREISKSMRYHFLLVHRSESLDSWSVLNALQRAAPLQGRETTLAEGLLFGATVTQAYLGVEYVVVAHPPRSIDMGHGMSLHRLSLRRGQLGDDLYASWREARNTHLASFIDAVLMAY